MWFRKSTSEKIFDFISYMASRTFEDAKDKGENAMKKTMKYVRENPEKSVIIAAALGAAATIALTSWLRR